MEKFDLYLSPTEVIDSDHPGVVEYALKSAGNSRDDVSKACALFRAVRDEIAYDLFSPFYLASHYQASTVLQRKSGFCVSKACLLCGLGRASGIPSRLGFADIRNYGASQEVVDQMGTNVFTFHGFVEFFLEGRWVRATPAFDPTVCEKHNIALVAFNGREDAVFPSHDLNGNRYVEYIRYHGSFADLPLEGLMPAFRTTYGDERIDLWIAALESGSRPA